MPFPESLHPYLADTNDAQEYSIPGASTLYVHFDALTETENTYDFIDVNRWDGAAWVLVETYTGTAAADVYVAVPGDQVQIVLTSDSSVQKWGYATTIGTTAPLPGLTITDTPVIRTEPVSLTLTGTHATGPFTFSLSSGTLPAGLTLAGNTITGTPTHIERRTVTIQVTDTPSGDVGTQDIQISVKPLVTCVAGNMDDPTQLFWYDDVHQNGDDWWILAEQQEQGPPVNNVYKDEKHWIDLLKSTDHGATWTRAFTWDINTQTGNTLTFQWGIMWTRAANKLIFLHGADASSTGWTSKLTAAIKMTQSEFDLDSETWTTQATATVAPAPIAYYYSDMLNSSTSTFQRVYNPSDSDNLDESTILQLSDGRIVWCYPTHNYPTSTGTGFSITITQNFPASYGNIRARIYTKATNTWSSEITLTSDGVSPGTSVFSHPWRDELGRPLQLFEVSGNVYLSWVLQQTYVNEALTPIAADWDTTRVSRINLTSGALAGTTFTLDTTGTGRMDGTRLDNEFWQGNANAQTWVHVGTEYWTALKGQAWDMGWGALPTVLRYNFDAANPSITFERIQTADPDDEDTPEWEFFDAGFSEFALQQSPETGHVVALGVGSAGGEFANSIVYWTNNADGTGWSGRNEIFRLNRDWQNATMADRDYWAGDIDDSLSMYKPRAMYYQGESIGTVLNVDTMFSIFVEAEPPANYLGALTPGIDLAF